MELSIWSSYYIDLSPEEMVCEFEKNGIFYSEFSDEHARALLQRGNAKEVGHQFKRFADEHNVKFPQGHLNLYCDICRDKSVIDDLKTWLDLYDAIGIKRAVLHCDEESFSETISDTEKSESNISALKERTAYKKDSDMIICIENLMGFTAEVDELLKIVNAVDSKNIGICLDTGHLNLTHKTQEEFIEKAGKHLKALHIADNEGKTDQHLK